MRNGRNNLLIGLTDLAKESYRKMKIIKHLIFPICFCQRETIYKFDKLSVFQVIRHFSCVLMQHEIDQFLISKTFLRVRDCKIQ